MVATGEFAGPDHSAHTEHTGAREMSKPVSDCRVLKGGLLLAWPKKFWIRGDNSSMIWAARREPLEQGNTRRKKGRGKSMASESRGWVVCWMGANCPLLPGKPKVLRPYFPRGGNYAHGLLDQFASPVRCGWGFRSLCRSPGMLGGAGWANSNPGSDLALLPRKNLRHGMAPRPGRVMIHGIFTTRKTRQ